MPEWLRSINDAWLEDQIFGRLTQYGLDARLPWEPSWLDIRIARLGR